MGYPMKRDMDLLRELLFRLEASPKIYAGRKSLSFEGRPDDEVTLHLKLLEDAGYIDRPPPARPVPGGAGIEIGMRLTHAGYEFLDSVRDPAIWSETKAGARKVGGFSVDLLMALAKGFIKKRLEENTGIQIDL